ncbi:protein bicaudal C homolog 1-A-like isoform X2 [Cotesia glomerata]|uniref:protein bicaudal C homolog 1-A-like isoform X2 n=1 Tax=Cotesia glomerata TaxID=32391 RepID=UPI001D014254|nr:protein bicaudal C homolog 1-A-like isoform X2 [Cotesia glomerata]
MEWPQATGHSLGSLDYDTDIHHDQSHTSKDLCSGMTSIFDEKFRLSNIFTTPPDQPENTSLKMSGANKVFKRSSTLILEDSDEYQMSMSCNNLLNSSDDPDPNTSTPEREKQSDRYKILRPPKLTINESIDEDTGIFDTVQCSPVKSPFPSDSPNNSSLGLDDTLLASSFESPPRPALFNQREKKLMNLLGRFGLSHFALLFIEQEVDVDLFLTLTNNDLKEIGIQRKTDRNIILSVIQECNKRLY